MLRLKFTYSFWEREKGTICELTQQIDPCAEWSEFVDVPTLKNCVRQRTIKHSEVH
jgi:MOSC domain-containing protein YiiM